MGRTLLQPPVYLMFIYYYNAKGELMNNQFIQNGQENIHQHFFIPKNIKSTFDGQSETRIIGGSNPELRIKMIMRSTRVNYLAPIMVISKQH